MSTVLHPYKWAGAVERLLETPATFDLALDLDALMGSNDGKPLSS